MLKKLMLVAALFGAGLSYAQPDLLLPSDIYQDGEELLPLIDTFKKNGKDGMQKLVNDCYSTTPNESLIKCIHLEILAGVIKVGIPDQDEETRNLEGEELDAVLIKSAMKLYDLGYSEEQILDFEDLLKKYIVVIIMSAEHFIYAKSNLSSDD